MVRVCVCMCACICVRACVLVCMQFVYCRQSFGVICPATTNMCALQLTSSEGTLRHSDKKENQLNNVVTYDLKRCFYSFCSFFWCFV